jgi:hypothetical protein
MDSGGTVFGACYFLRDWPHLGFYSIVATVV